jgi:hypothetical protein
MTGPARPYRRWQRVGVAAAVACGMCCAVPLIAVLVGVGVTSATLGTVFQVVELASLVLAVLALGGAGVLWVRRRRRACRVPDRVADLGLPEPTRRGPA